MTQVIVIGSAHSRRRRRLIRVGLIVSAVLGALWLGSCGVTVVWVAPREEMSPIFYSAAAFVLSDGLVVHGDTVCAPYVRGSGEGLSVFSTRQVRHGYVGSGYLVGPMAVYGCSSIYLFKPVLVILLLTWLLSRKERREAFARANGRSVLRTEREQPGPVLRAVLTVLFAIVLLFPAPVVAAWWVWFFFNEGSYRQPFLTFFQAAAPVKVAFVALALGFMYAGLLLFHDRLRWKRTQFVHGFCSTCGYDLRGNVSGICPECGTPADVWRRVFSESEKRAAARTRPEITCVNLPVGV
ncbi:MAG: hypothetical protein HUU22_02770 [Phycisphaerae bacterium]|nr:hypothetical protein [Phycisphaerae bacterium]NUQ44937.1 hypothetical protein [Phycisphaerae bacterium]